MGQTTGVVIMAVADEKSLDSPQVFAQLAGIRDQSLTLASIEQIIALRCF